MPVGSVNRNANGLPYTVGRAEQRCRGVGLSGAHSESRSGVDRIRRRVRAPSRRYVVRLDEKPARVVELASRQPILGPVRLDHGHVQLIGDPWGLRERLLEDMGARLEVVFGDSQRRDHTECGRLAPSVFPRPVQLKSLFGVTLGGVDCAGERGHQAATEQRICEHVVVIQVARDRDGFCESRLRGGVVALPRLEQSGDGEQARCAISRSRPCDARASRDQRRHSSSRPLIHASSHIDQTMRPTSSGSP